MSYKKKTVTANYIFYLAFIFSFILNPFHVSAKDIPLDSSGQTLFRNGYMFVQTHPKIKQPVWMYDCRRSDEHGEECLEGGWKDIYFEQEIKPKYINVNVFTTPQQAQAALELYYKMEEVSLKKSFQAQDEKLSKDIHITDIKRENNPLPLSGADAGFLSEYKRSYTEHSENYKRTGSRTYHFYQIRGAFRKGRVVFTLNTPVGGFWNGYQGDYWSYIFSQENDGKRKSGDDKNEKELYELQRKQIIDFAAKVLPYSKKIEDDWLAFYSEFKKEFLSGKDFSDMSLAELVDSTSINFSPKSFNSQKRDLELRLNAMKEYPESMNPEFPGFCSEFSSYENNPEMMSIYRWHIPLREYAAESKTALLDFSPHWEILEMDIIAHYLHTIKSLLEKGEKLSDTRLKILRHGMISLGRGLNIQGPREIYSDFGNSARTLSRQSLFDILDMTGTSFGVRDDAFLSVKADINNLKADGSSSSLLTISLFDKSTGNNSSRTPLKVKSITVKNVPYNGRPVGNLSNRTIITDNNGSAQVIYTAPDKEDIPPGPVPRAEIIVRCDDLNVQETLYIDLFAGESIKIKPAYTILPAHKDYKNELTFRFENPDKDWGKVYKAIIKNNSGHGRFISASEEMPRKELTIDATSGTDNVITYFWDGPQPADSAIEEQVSIEIPDLELSGTLTFSVGIDLMADEVAVSWKPPFQPFLTIPIHVYIRDRFHPDADIEKMFSDFQIEPKLTVEQTGFSPPAVFSGPDSGEDELLSSVSTFIEQSTRSKQQSNSLTRDIVLGTVKKTKDNRWLLVSKDLSGEGIPIDQMFPAIVPFVRGTFHASVTLDPNFKGDALTEDHTKELTPLEVSRVSARQGELEYFLLPTLKAVAGLTPQGSLGFGLTDIALKSRAGDYKGAIITAGQMLAGKIIGDGLGDTMKAGYKKSMNAFYKEQTAKAFGTTVNALHPGQAELALRLAKPYKLASWVETITGWALDQAISDATSSGRSPYSPSVFQKSLFAYLDDLIFPKAHAGEISNKTLVDQSLDFLAFLSQGYGNEYGVIVITRSGLDTVSASDSEGRQLKKIPDSVFAGKDSLEMIKTGKRVVVIPFEKGKSITLHMTGQGDPVRIYKILDTSVTKGVLDYQGKSWEKSLKVNG